MKLHLIIADGHTGPFVADCVGPRAEKFPRAVSLALERAEEMYDLPLRTVVVEVPDDALDPREAASEDNS